jgi:large subunit ribosomal protein L18
MSNVQNQKRKQRIRNKLRKVNLDRPRLSIYRTNVHTYAQVIDDSKSITLVAASTLEKDVRGDFSNGGNKAAASILGKLIAERALKAGVTKVVFDRSGYLYHGRVKALADAARENGLDF